MKTLYNIQKHFNLEELVKLPRRDSLDFGSPVKVRPKGIA